MIELSSTEIPSMLSMESAAIVIEISTIPIVTAPRGICVVGVTGVISFGGPEPGFNADLRIGGVSHQASGYDH
jgi:hypothetical protein